MHWLLTLIPVAMAASGIGMMVLSGAADALTGGGPLPDFEQFLPRGPHGAGARVLRGTTGVLHATVTNAVIMCWVLLAAAKISAPTLPA